LVLISIITNYVISNIKESYYHFYGHLSCCASGMTLSGELGAVAPMILLGYRWHLNFYELSAVS